ncbi:MAG TPA: TonB-dependent receptor [Blastocatellia bacterium]|nr:TonB-dependent receptor [Blastocatellia bacterium]
MIHSRSVFRSGLMVIFVVMSAVAAFAQNTTISGAVTDPQGNAIAGATVTAINKSTGLTRTVTTTSEGTYQIPQIVPGTYQVRVEAQGFKAVIQENVQVLVSTPLTLNISFRDVGAVSESVTVQGGESVLNTSDATIGNTFENRKVVELPLNARNVVGLLSLQPGVTASGEVNGGRSDQANVTLDGVDVNEQQGGAAFFSVLRSTPDSLQEFRVTTTNPNADQGRSSGAQVALVTKSGTNTFHGSLYEYHRNTITTANDWFNNKAGVERPKLLRNIFGGAIGGPIKKDKAFFFFTYEGFREATGTTVVREVPLPSLGQGIVRYITEDGKSNQFNSCPAGTPAGVNCLSRSQISTGYLAAYGVDPGTNSAAIAVLAAAANRYKANDTTVGDGLNTSGFRFNANTPSNLNVSYLRFDYNLTDKQSVFARGGYQSDNITRTQRFPDTLAPKTWVHPIGLSLGHQWTLSNTLVNTARYGLTRSAFTVGGDSQANSISFRFIFQPLNFSRTLSRITPVHNFTDDLAWSKGNHALQFGTNIRLIRNSRNSLGSSFDVAVTNPSFYDFSGDVVVTDDFGDPIFPNVGGSTDDLRDALTALIGRYTQYSFNLNYAKSGQLQPVGTPVKRDFKTQEYEAYAQDSWRIRPNLTVGYGLRWSTSTPVYEANGLQVKPVQSLGKFFEQRVAGANAGKPFNDLISVDLAGKANGRDGYYDQDWNNFAPSVSVAWSPNFRSGLLKTILGENKSTFRGGFRMTYDRIGSALAVAFDLNSTLGYRLGPAIAANTFNVSDRLGPLFTGFDQNLRGLPRLTVNPTLTFPLTTPADEDQRIEQSLDDRLRTPYNYSFNLSYGRDLGRGYSFEVSYVGRIARDLLVSRDILHLNNLKDPKSGTDWYTAIRQLIDLRYKDAAITSVQPIPYFENIVPGLAGTYNVLGTNRVLTATQAAYRRIAKTAVGGRNTTDYTFVQLLWDDGLGYGNNLFFHPQYATFAAYSTIGTSDYNSLQMSFRKRFGNNLTFDFNYTLAHSFDTASGTESSGTISSGASLILNPLNLDVNRGPSDFDIRHLINANYIYNLPFGKGQKFFGNMSRVGDAFFGGWSLTGIFRWNTGLPAGQPYDDARWATNWNVQSNAVAIRPVVTDPTRTGDPNLFSDPAGAYHSYRNPYPGEQGDRNSLRDPGYVALDAGLYKTFTLPGEKIKLKFRWEVYNVTNTQRFTGVDGDGFGLPRDPFLGGTPPTGFGKLTATQAPLNENKAGRVMQFALRIEF